MANLQVKDINSKLYESLKRRAELEHRSVSQEVILIIENHLIIKQNENIQNTHEFLRLSNSWIDPRSEKEIVKELRKSRSKKNRSTVFHELFT
ncbi:MAG: antitoxin [Leptospiraceae bacterium]|nr:antitoxin [Leptospiraceae bacterium]